MILRQARTVIALVLFCCVASPAWAESLAPPVQDPVDQMMGRYNIHPAVVKFGRGISNVLGGWLEIPLNIGQRMSASDTVGSFFTGAVYGLVKGTVRTGVGLYETVTFFLPFPEHFRPILPTLEYYNRGKGRRELPLE